MCKRLLYSGQVSLALGQFELFAGSSEPVGSLILAFDLAQRAAEQLQGLGITLFQLQVAFEESHGAGSVVLFQELFCLGLDVLGGV